MKCQKCGKELEAYEDNLFGLEDFEYLCSGCRPADPAPAVDDDAPGYEGEPIEHSIYRSPSPQRCVQCGTYTTRLVFVGTQTDQGLCVTCFHALQESCDRIKSKKREFGLE